MRHIIGNRRLVSLIIATAFFIVSVFAFAGNASAITSSNYTSAVKSCEEIQDKLYAKTEDFSKKRQNHLDKYEQINDIFSSVTDTLNGAGYDTALLTELQPGLERRITNFADVSQIFLNEMKDSGDSACRDKQSFSQELQEARTSLKEVQVSVADIQNYIQQIIIPTIKDVIEEGVN